MAEKTLTDKIALITGGAGGFGQVLTRALLAAGAKVAILDIAERELTAFADELKASHPGAFMPLVADLADDKQCAAAVRQTVSQLGGVHILINNGAVGMGAIRNDHMTRMVQLHEITPELWQLFIDTNLSGAFYMTRAAMPHLLAQRWGRVITITTSFFTMLRSGFAPYGPAKAGLEALSAGHAKEFTGSGVTVNVVVPGGPSDTPMVPLESGFDRAALVPPSAMVPPILWLCSTAGDALTGRRYVAAQWDASLPPAQAAERCGAPIGWETLAQNPVWPGGKPSA